MQTNRQTNKTEILFTLLTRPPYRGAQQKSCKPTLIARDNVHIISWIHQMWNIITI